MTSAQRPAPQPRASYKAFRTLTTRWMDNDVYGHVNNVIYYSWFDTAVNAHLIEHGALDTQHGASIGLVVETQCNYFAPLSFPQDIVAVSYTQTRRPLTALPSSLVDVLKALES